MALSNIRHVDMMPNLSSPRPAEMKVLCLGLSRTATMSLYSALGKLGYKSYHFMEMMKPENVRLGHVYAWHEAMKAKVDEEGSPFGRKEFDKLLGHYSAVTDAPCACFVDELIAAYPNTKVVLGVRNTERWVASMERSYYRVMGWKSWEVLTWFYTGLATELSLINMILRLWTDNEINNREKLIEGYLKHNEHVRATVPKDNLLEFWPEQGWKPLCEFLGKEIPDESYPRINEGDNAASIFAGMYWYLVGKLALRAAVVPVVVGVLAWAIA